MYAVVEAKGKQHKVSVGDVVFLDRLLVKDGENFQFDKVLLIDDGTKVNFGKPYVKGASVDAKIIKTAKQKKIRVFKYKPKKNYKRTYGHRQFYTKLEIMSINNKN